MNGTLGEIRLFAGDYAPKNWAFCDGQLLQINVNRALYSILGDRFGGNGQTNFALPDMRGRLAVCAGKGVQFYDNLPPVQLSTYSLGQTGGVETVTLQVSNVPIHDHTVSGTVTMPCFTGNGNADTPTGACPAVYPGRNMYNTSLNSFTMSAMQFNLNTDQKGLSHPFNIIQPVLGLSFIICISGLFPESP